MAKRAKWGVFGVWIGLVCFQYFRLTTFATLAYLKVFRGKNDELVKKETD